MNKLWIIGDSFSAVHPDDLNKKDWPTRLASMISAEVINGSGHGTCQDWAVEQIQKWRKDISSDDQLILTLTDPARFYFSEHTPHLTNASTVDFYNTLPPRVSDAAKTFLTFIHRPALAEQWVNHRLGWLNNIATINNWRKPVVIHCFPTDIDITDYPNLIFSHGSLLDISENEYIKEFQNTDASRNLKFWNHNDARSCHLCYSNHEILALKIYESITNNALLDLTLGFNKEILNLEILEDTAFINAELSPYEYKRYAEAKTNTPHRWQSAMQYCKNLLE